MFELTNNLSFSIHGGADAGGVASGLADLLGHIEDVLVLSPGDMFAAIFPGIAAMENLHPLFVHFPIALLSLHFVLDLVASMAARSDWRKFASWLLYAGTAFAGITVAMGLLAASSVVHGDEVHQIMENHEHLGVSILLLAIALSVWRAIAKSVEGAANTLYLILAGSMVVLLTFAADLGGDMVYRYGVAVKAVEKGETMVDHVHEHDHHQHHH